MGTLSGRGNSSGEKKAIFPEVSARSRRADVNNAAYLNEKMFVRPFWEAPVELANIIDVGLRCRHVATYYAAPLLIAQRRGLIVNVSFYGNAKVHDPAYYASKAGLDKWPPSMRSISRRST